jgi:hypothetical protein
MAKIETLKLEIQFSPSSKESKEMMIMKSEINGHADSELWSYPIVIINQIAEWLSHMSLGTHDEIYLPIKTWLIFRSSFLLAITNERLSSQMPHLWWERDVSYSGKKTQRQINNMGFLCLFWLRRWKQGVEEMSDLTPNEKIEILISIAELMGNMIVEKQKLDNEYILTVKVYR